MDAATSAAAGRGRGAPLDVEALPLELLERVLGWLPVADLIALRAVNRRWRAAVAALAARDRPFAFTCGVGDLLRTAPWLQEERASAATPTAEEEDTERSVTALLQDFLEHASREGRLPCTCGTPRVLDYHSASASAVVARRPHAITQLPARWQVLVPERRLALEVSALAMTLLRHCSILEHAYYRCGGGCTNEWLPAWFYLPTDVPRPTSSVALRRLARALTSAAVQEDAPSLLQALADPDVARRFYADAERDAAEQTAGDEHDAEDDPDGGDHGFHNDSGFNDEGGGGGGAAAAAAPGGPQNPKRPTPTRTRACDWKNAASWMNAGYPGGERGPDAGPTAAVEPLVTAHYKTFCNVTAAIHRKHPLFRRATARVRATDLTGLDVLRLEARQSAAAWRICRDLHWTAWLKSSPDRTGSDAFYWRLHRNGAVTTEDGIQAHLDAQVAATDHTIAEIRRLLRYPVVLGSSTGDGGHGGPLWVLGLSPGGHLVGAVAYVLSTD